MSADVTGPTDARAILEKLRSMLARERDRQSGWVDESPYAEGAADAYDYAIGEIGHQLTELNGGAP